MNINSILKKVSKPSRYKPIESIPYTFTNDLEKIAVFNLGNYESHLSSLDFQTLYALFAESKKFRPYRFFMPEYDFLTQLKANENIKLWSVDEEEIIDEFKFFLLYLNSDEALYQLLILKKYLPENARVVLIQNSKIISPLAKDIAELVLCGSDVNKLKACIKTSENLKSLYTTFLDKATDSVYNFDTENGIGALNKYISPIINVKTSDNLFRYIYQSYEYRSPDLFNVKSKTNDGIIQNSQKRLNEKIRNMPNENEIAIFPLGISDRIQHYLNIQKTYRSSFITTKKLLSLGYRSIHVYYWIGHPLEEKGDWIFFKKQISAIYEYTKDFKKINIQFHFGLYNPSGNSEFLWDDVYGPVEYNEKKEELKRLFQEKETFRVQFESFTSHFMRLFALRANEEDYKQLLKEFEAFYSESSDLSTEMFFQQHLRNNSGFEKLFQAQAYGRTDFNYLNLNDTLLNDLQEKRKSVSATLVDEVINDELNFNIQIVKKALPNLNSFISKTQDNIATHLAETEMSFGRSVKRRAAQQQDFARKYRVKFKKFDRMIFYTGTDVRNIIINSFESLKIPIIYTKGFTPAPKIAFAAPVNQGIVSVAEFFDVEINTIKEFNLKELLNDSLPYGLEVLDYKEVPVKKESLASKINCNNYEFDFSNTEVDEFTVKEWLDLEDKTIEREHKGVKLLLNVSDFISHKFIKDKILKLTVKNLDQRMLKAEEILSSLSDFCSFGLFDVDVTRTNQFITNEDGNSTEVMEL